MIRSPFSPEYRRLSFGIISLVSVFGFEGIAVPTVMPVAAAEFNAISNYSIAFTSFTMASLLGMTMAGLWSNRFGALFSVASSAIFLGLGSLIAGMANSIEILALGRGVQGLGMGIDLVTMYVLIGRLYPDHIRNKAIGMLASAWLIPGLVGPGIAGLLTDLYSWRFVFGIVPVLLIAPAILLTPRLRDIPKLEVPPRTDTRVQLAAVTLAIGALIVFQTATSHIGQWPTAQLVLSISAALAILVWSIQHLMPKGYLRRAPGIPSVIGLRGVLAGAYFAAEIFLPLALQELRGVSVTLSGAVLTSATIFWSTGSYLQGSHRIKLSHENLLRIGILSSTLGILLTPIAVFLPEDPNVAAIAASAVWGFSAFGTGLCFPIIGGLVLELSDREDHPKLSASLQMSDSLGVILMTAIAGSILAIASFHNSLSSQTFIQMWIFCGVLGLFGLTFVSQIHRNGVKAR